MCAFTVERRGACNEIFLIVVTGLSICAALPPTTTPCNLRLHRSANRRAPRSSRHSLSAYRDQAAQFRPAGVDETDMPHRSTANESGTETIRSWMVRRTDRTLASD
jgi:hypothetical protein